MYEANFLEMFFYIVIIIFTSRWKMTIFASQNELFIYLFDIESVNDNIIKSRCFFLKMHSFILQIFIECFPLFVPHSSFCHSLPEISFLSCVNFIQNCLFSFNVLNL